MYVLHLNFEPLHTSKAIQYLQSRRSKYLQQWNWNGNIFCVGYRFSLLRFWVLTLRVNLDSILLSYPPSMGGVILLRYLGDLGKRNPRTASELGIVAACVVSSPIDVVRTARSLGGMDTRADGGGGFLSVMMARSVNCLMTIPLKLQILSQWSWLRSRAVRQKISLSQLLLATSLREVEQAVVCPLHGYADPDDYYHSNSPLPLLAYIAVPVLVFSALDDPVVYSSQEGATASRQAIRGGNHGEGHGNPYIIMAEYQNVGRMNCPIKIMIYHTHTHTPFSFYQGGHLGWTGRPGNLGRIFGSLSTSWSDYVVKEYFSCHDSLEEEPWENVGARCPSPRPISRL
jgi:hypothetical protein